MKLTEKLDLLMKERGISSRMQLSELSGVPYMTIVNFYQKGTENVKLSTLRKLANFFNVSLDYLADDNITDYNTDNNELISLPIYGKISCGGGVLVCEEIEGYEVTPKDWLRSGSYFYLRAKGDSMIGERIYDGDLLLIRKQPTVENGEIAAVLLNESEEAVLKKVYKEGNTLILQSANPTYPPIICPPASCTILGKLKKIVINL